MTDRPPLIVADSQRCRACWRCVRLCPTHAIRATNGSAEVIAQKCIGCGACVSACGNGSFRVRNDGALVDGLLRGGRPVVALLATEFVAAMHPMTPEEVERALDSAGFYAVESTLLGEEVVALQYEALHAADSGVPVIRSTCPVVNDWVRRYHPALVGALASVVPPYVAQAAIIKSLYPTGTAVVYVSPCYARKDEALLPEFEGVVDAAIGFDELKRAIARLDVSAPKTGRDRRPPAERRPEPLKEVSLTDGYPRSTLASHGMLDPAVRVVRGLAELDALLTAIEAGEIAPAIIDALNCEGCIDGPTVNPGMSLFAKRNLEAAERLRRVRTAVSSREVVRHLPPLELRRSFAPAPVDVPVPDAATLRGILREAGFVEEGDLVDCRACGYDTCLEHAAAVYRGDSTWEVCFPVQRRKLAEEMAQLQEFATLDALTGLWNRRVFSDRLEDECARHTRYGGTLCLLMLDLDVFKSVNDQHGHPNGDAVLVAVAELLRHTLRATDYPCRYGGDEFAVILPETAKTEAFAVAEKVRRAVSEMGVEVAPGGSSQRLEVRVSIGVAAARSGAQPLDLLEAADRALYQAKEMGRDQVRLAPG
jgi:diguanylate cyclase (GGDEF)-like protein